MKFDSHVCNAARSLNGDRHPLKLAIVVKDLIHKFI